MRPISISPACVLRAASDRSSIVRQSNSNSKTRTKRACILPWSAQAVILGDVVPIAAPVRIATGASATPHGARRPHHRPGPHRRRRPGPDHPRRAGSHRRRRAPVRITHAAQVLIPPEPLSASTPVPRTASPPPPRSAPYPASSAAPSPASAKASPLLCSGVATPRLPAVVACCWRRSSMVSGFQVLSSQRLCHRRPSLIPDFGAAISGDLPGSS